MTRHVINAPDAPQSPGTYAQAIRFDGARDVLLISGQIGANPDGEVPDDPLQQARLIWGNIDAQLRAAGMSKLDLAKVTIYLSDRALTDVYRQARDEYLDGHQVALTCVIAGIFDAGWVMEIEAMAIR